MKMLRWMCGVTRKDKIRNEHMRGTTRMVQASQKELVRACDEERWRQDEEHTVKKVLMTDIRGKRKREDNRNIMESD